MLDLLAFVQAFDAAHPVLSALAGTAASLVASVPVDMARRALRAYVRPPVASPEAAPEPLFLLALPRPQPVPPSPSHAPDRPAVVRRRRPGFPPSRAGVSRPRVRPVAPLSGAHA